MKFRLHQIKMPRSSAGKFRVFPASLHSNNHNKKGSQNHQKSKEPFIQNLWDQAQSLTKRHEGHTGNFQETLLKLDTWSISLHRHRVRAPSPTNHSTNQQPHQAIRCSLSGVISPENPKSDTRIWWSITNQTHYDIVQSPSSHCMYSPVSSSHCGS